MYALRGLYFQEAIFRCQKWVLDKRGLRGTRHGMSRQIASAQLLLDRGADRAMKDMFGDMLFNLRFRWLISAGVQGHKSVLHQFPVIFHYLGTPDFQCSIHDTKLSHQGTATTRRQPQMR